MTEIYLGNIKGPKGEDGQDPDLDNFYTKNQTDIKISSDISRTVDQYFGKIIGEQLFVLSNENDFSDITLDPPNNSENLVYITSDEKNTTEGYTITGFTKGNNRCIYLVFTQRNSENFNFRFNNETTNKTMVFKNFDNMQDFEINFARQNIIFRVTQIDNIRVIEFLADDYD